MKRRLYRFVVGTKLGLSFCPIVLSVLVHYSIIDAGAAKDYQNKAQCAQSFLTPIALCLKPRDKNRK